MGLIKEFRDFAAKGNVIDMGVGIVIGAAFTSIVNSLVKDILNPIIGYVTGGVDFSNMYVNLGKGEYASLAEAQAAGAATINYGLFINAVISFMIVAFFLFLLVKGVNRMKDQFEREAADPASPVKPPRQEVLLEEIRDAIRNRGGSTD